MIQELYRKLEKNVPFVKVLKNLYGKLPGRGMPRRYHYLYSAVRENRAKKIMEIGTWTGIHALGMIEQAKRYSSPLEIEYYGFDLFESLDQNTGEKEFSIPPPAQKEVEEKIRKTGVKVHLYKGYTKDTLPVAIEKMPIMDFIYIDGGHSLETIETDWSYAQKVMGENTIVIFDDYWNMDKAGCKKTIEKIDKKLFDVVILPVQDKFKKDWGTLTINFVRVTRKGRKIVVQRSQALRKMYYTVNQISDVLKALYVRLGNSRRINSYLVSHDFKKLHLGAGGNILAGWCNTDIVPDIKQGVFLDVTKRFPFHDNTFDYIFTEHTMEHIEIRTGIRMLKECFRVLKPGGKLRISMPNLAFLIGLYKEEKTELQLREIKRIVDMVFPDIGIYQDAFVINNFFKNWGHKFIYDFKLLKLLLEKNGFSNVIEREVGKSEDINLQNLEAHGAFISEESNRLQSFVVEGTKIK